MRSIFYRTVGVKPNLKFYDIYAFNHSRIIKTREWNKVELTQQAYYYKQPLMRNYRTLYPLND